MYNVLSLSPSLPHFTSCSILLYAGRWWRFFSLSLAVFVFRPMRFFSRLRLKRIEFFWLHLFCTNCMMFLKYSFASSCYLFPSFYYYLLGPLLICISNVFEYGIELARCTRIWDDDDDWEKQQQKWDGMKWVVERAKSSQQAGKKARWWWWWWRRRRRQKYTMIRNYGIKYM